jgi:hypothetical protein
VPAVSAEGTQTAVMDVMGQPTIYGQTARGPTHRVAPRCAVPTYANPIADVLLRSCRGS